MKWYHTAIVLILLVVSFLFALTATPVFADSPQPYVYALVKCSSLTIPQLTQAEQAFDTQYGWDHQLTTDAQWKASYESRVNEFASSLGCPQVLNDNQLTFWYKIYVPTYSKILRGSIP